MNKAKLALIGSIFLVFLVATFNFITILSSAEKVQIKRVEKFIEIAEKAEEKAEKLLYLILSSKVAEKLDQTKIDEVKAKFNLGVEKLDNAKDNLLNENLEYAIGNATEAFQIFREVFKALHSMLGEAGYGLGDVINASGLITAMDRALQRIERLREIIPEDSQEINKLLNEAEGYLNIEKAIKLLSQGKINETAHRLAEANKLIAQAHKLLKNKAQQLNVKRLKSFINAIENFYKRLERKITKFGNETLQNKLTDAKTHITLTKEKFEQKMYSEALSELITARTLLEEVELGLKQLRHGHGK